MTAADLEGCGWIPIGTRVVRTIRDSAHRHLPSTENLNRRGTIVGHETHPSLTFYRILFDGDAEYTRYVAGHRGIVPLSAVDLLGEIGRMERAREALERGMRDGLRLQNGEVSADALCAELAEDPL